MLRMLSIVSLTVVSSANAIELQPCDQQAVPEMEKRLECLQRNIVALSNALDEKITALNKEHEDKFVRYGADITIRNATKPALCLEKENSANTYHKAYFGPCGQGLRGSSAQRHTINKN